jgi:TPP-dependent pyruvate/acetoin dehydrogenase alpha subunit
VQVAGANSAVCSAASSEAGQLYGTMYLLRRVEETLLELFAAGKLSGTTHTCIGQEANAVGVIAHLEHGRDIVMSNHRGHGHYLALTDDLDGLLREVMGKEGGVCGGKGGSQHLCNNGFYSNGILGSTLPIAAGMALAERERASGAVTAVFLGDGALGEGVVYETLNIASLWKLPLLFVVENNFYAQTTPSRLQLAGTIVGRAAAFGLTSAHVATTDVEEIEAVAEQAVASIRETGEPTFLVIDTYRLAPHSKGDDFRDPAEIELARRSDPLRVAGSRLADEEREAIHAACESRLRQALDEAERARPASAL